MADPSFDKQYAEKIVKKLRRFASSLIADRQLADTALFDVINRNRHLLRGNHYQDLHYVEMLIAIYLTIGRIDQSYAKIKARNANDNSVFNLFQSLDYLQKTVMSLFLIEQLPRDTIAMIVDMPVNKVSIMINDNIAALSDSERPIS